MEGIIDIKNYLPHRPPMLMVDWIVALDDQMVETTFGLKEDNIFMQDGHLVEAGLIENAAQTCSAIVAKGFYVDQHDQGREGVEVIGFISALKTLKIHALPLAGTTITTKAVLASAFETDDYTLCTMACTTFCGEEFLLEGEINLFIQENRSAASETAGREQAPKN